MNQGGCGCALVISEAHGSGQAGYAMSSAFNGGAHAPNAGRRDEARREMDTRFDVDRMVSVAGACGARCEREFLDCERRVTAAPRRPGSVTWKRNDHPHLVFELRTVTR